MMSLTFGLFTQVSDSGPHGPLVLFYHLIKVKNSLMTGAINYVRREGRYVMKNYLVAVISVWRPPSDFLQ